MSTPAENKQTVEAALGFAENVARYEDDLLWIQNVRDARVALRDLVAQADRAAELEAALRAGLRLHKRTFPHRGAWLAACDRWEKKTEALLAGDGGGA